MQYVMKEGFITEFKFPNVVGCVDGYLIPIKAPSSREDIYIFAERAIMPSTFKAFVTVERNLPT